MAQDDGLHGTERWRSADGAVAAGQPVGRMVPPGLRPAAYGRAGAPYPALVSRAPAPPLTPAAWLRFDAIRRSLGDARPLQVLEIGAGMGAMGWRLAQDRRYVGVEPDARSAEAAARRLQGRGTLIHGGLEELSDGLRRERFDMVCAFEVLEHIPDDRSALADWSALLRPGGHLLISVPAHARRFAAGDHAVGHVRRYDREPLARLLEECGFDIERWEAWGGGLGHALEAARNALARRHDGDDTAEARSSSSGRLRQPGGRLAGLAAWMLAAPFRILQRPLAHTPVGIGWVVLARRR